MTALGVEGIAAHQLVSLYRGHEMLWQRIAVDRDTTYEIVTLR